MKKLQLALFLLFSCNVMFGQSPERDRNWTLNTFKSDEFNGSSLGSKWDKLSGVSHWGQEYWNPTHVELSNGIMKFKASNINGIIHSGGIQSKNFDNSYGYYELSALLPCGKGFWPTFWLWAGENCENPEPLWYDEIDILEPDGCDMDTCTINGVGVHANVVGICHKQEKVFEHRNRNLPLLSSGFYKYAAEWLPDKVIFYFEDESFTFTKDSVPERKLQVLTSLQISGGSCGPDILNFRESYMEVDYYRYYSLKMDCNRNYLISGTFDFTNDYNFKVRKSITLSNVALNDQYVTLRATDFIHIESNFTVPPNTVFNATITPCISSGTPIYDL